MRIAVVGGTGMVGRHVVSAAVDAGHEPVVLARSRGVDVVTGQGLDVALEGADAVIDVANVTTLSATKAAEFFRAGSRNLLAAGLRAGVRHHVALSIVGIDRVTTGYYRGKLAQEAVVLSGAVPASVLRSTQFHEFTSQILALSRGPVALVPRILIQPVASREVAVSLVELAAGPAVGHAPELAGPEEHLLPELVHRLLRARRQRRLLLPVRLPGAAGRAMAEGALLPTVPGPRGRQTYAQWLATITADDAAR